MIIVMYIQAEELVKRLSELEHSASCDAAVREKIAALPLEVSDISHLEKIQGEPPCLILSCQLWGGNNNNNNRIQRRYSRFFTISSQRHETDEGGEETRVPGENPWRRASENATY